MQTVNLVAVVSLAFVAPLIVAAVNTAAQGPEAVEAALGLDRQTRRLIQQGLESEGFDPGPPDGLFGPRTRAAIRTWQAARELADTGYVDGPQAEALRAAGSPPAAGGGDTEAGVPGASVLAVSDRKASEAEPVSASGTVETSMSAVVPPPAVQAAPMINPGADAPAARAARNSQLPPVILIDRHLVRVDRLLAADDHQEASEVLNEIVALQREHDLTLPAEFHFAHAQVAFAAGLAEAAVTAANKYLAAAGRDGQFYRDALKLLDAAEVAIVNADLPPQPGDVFRDCDVCPEMVVMPGGRLALGRYEVTVAEYRAFVSATGKSPDDCWQDPGHPQTLRHPVTCLDWHDVQAYLSWLSHTAQAPYRLPTEREWERAAVGSTRGCARPRVDSDDRTCPVGSYGANLWGLSDMVGNVSEVTATCYHDDFCSHHVARGGSWLVITAPIDGNDDQWGYHYPAATDREQMGLAARWSTAGFRVARRVDVVDMLDAAEQAVRRAEAERGRLATLRRENDELARRQVELAAVPLPRDPLRSGGLAPAMVTVAAGSFQYRTSQHWRWGSRPHLEWVTFDRPFAIGKYEVTRGDFELFVSRARYRTRRPARPRVWLRGPSNSCPTKKQRAQMEPPWFRPDDQASCDLRECSRRGRLCQLALPANRPPLPPSGCRRLAVRRPRRLARRNAVRQPG